ncbi:MAG: hypothetical protein F9K18_11690 [Thermoanaerobaculia bacterium]|nr:MAG: hypothetical protein F9K18_11690 [Thermoanaerobaculia bacterium]
MRRPSWRLGAAVIALASLGAAAPGAEEEVRGSATGRFASRGISFEVADAYAFPADATLGEERVLAVAISNSGFNEEFISRYRDRRSLLDNYFRDDQTALVYFEFTPDGVYRGLSYYLESGNGCGYCSGGVTSTVRRTGGRLVGRLSSEDAESERSFSIDLDVPVAGEEFGRAQGAGGGDPGAAYLAFHQAVVAGDAAGLRASVGQNLRETLANAEQAGQGAEYLAWLKGEHAATVLVTEGYVDGDRALLILAGERGSGKVAGEAILVRERDAWKVDDEMFELVLE